MKNTALEQKFAEIDESFREMEGLADLYEGLVGEGATDKIDLDIRKEEAKFARDRLLRLSLHAKNIIERIQTK